MTKHPAAASHSPRPSSAGEAALRWVSPGAAATLGGIVAGWGKAEWEAARRALLVHGVGPLAFHALRETAAWPLLPPRLQTWLNAQYHLNGQRVARLMGEAEQMLAAAAQAGIPVVPLKGSALLFHGYADPALRTMADLDLLVRPGDEAAFARCLHEVGYELTERTRRHRTYRPGGQPTPLFLDGEHPDNPRHVELHTRVREWYWGMEYELTAALWQGQVARFGAATALLSAPVTRLEHLLVHASMDLVGQKARLVRFYDIFLLGATLGAAEWNTLLQSAQQHREERLLYASLSLARRHFPFEAPDDVLAALADGTPPRLRAFLERATLFDLSHCNPQPLALGDRLAWHRPGREQWAAITARFFPAPQVLQQFYPHLAHPLQLPLAYLAHLQRLSVGAWRRVARPALRRRRL